MLKAGSNILTIWSGINFLLAALILTSVVVFNADSPLLALVFEKSEIAGLSAKTIEALNTLTILYNSCSMVVSVLVWISHSEKPDRRPKMGLLGAAVRDRLCGSDGLYRFGADRKRALASECGPECFIRCGHWPMCLSHIQAHKQSASSDHSIRKRSSHESHCLHPIRFTGCSSTPRSRKTYSKR